MPSSAATVLVGTHTYAATGESLRRQEAAVGTAVSLEHAHVVDVQFEGDAYRHPRLETLPVLRLDAPRVTGRPGVRKPIVSEILDVLCAEAARRGCAVFGFANADVHLSRAAVDLVRDASREAVVFCREDFDGRTGRSCGVQTRGVDVFAFRTAWWLRHRHRFRRYVLGEPAWDNVFTSIAMCHADGVIENARGLVRHERHATRWTPGEGAYAEYTRLLAALDAWYFTRWCIYVEGLDDLRRHGADVRAEQALARRAFRWPPGPAARAVQAARSVKARIRYAASTALGSATRG